MTVIPHFPTMTAEKYSRALRELKREGRITDTDIKFLRAHLAAPRRTVTWDQLARLLRYPTQSTVHLLYGRFARKLGEAMHFSDPPRDFWLSVVAEWADRPGPKGFTAFVLRPELATALRKTNVL